MAVNTQILMCFHFGEMMSDTVAANVITTCVNYASMRGLNLGTLATGEQMRDKMGHKVGEQAHAQYNGREQAAGIAQCNGGEDAQLI
jgi:hypothetical protein